MLRHPAEGRVNAAAVYARRLDQIANRRRLVAAPPENCHRAIKHFTPLKLFYARHFFQLCWNCYRARTPHFFHLKDTAI